VDTVGQGGNMADRSSESELTDTHQRELTEWEHDLSCTFT
jgi:hypothetical protein